MIFQTFAELCQRIEKIRGRLDTIEILSEVIRDLDPEDLPIFVRLVLGRPFPEWSPLKLGIGPNLLYEAVAYVTGRNREEVIGTLNSVGDLGRAVAQMLASKSQTSFFTDELTLAEVYTSFEAIARAEGTRSQKERVRIIQRLFSSATPLEGHYITGILLDDMRIGVGEGNVRDAVAKAFSVDSKQVEYAQQVLNDMGAVAVLAREGEAALSSVRMQIFHPVRMMLARQGTISQVLSDSGTIAIEYKYDGARFQFHKQGNVARMYSRRLEDVTDSLPDVVSMLLGATNHDLILDGEVIAILDGKPLPFQHVLKRFRRKHGVADAVDQVRLVPNVFDILYLDGEMLLLRPFSERREILCRVLNQYATPQLVSDDADAIETYYHSALDAGHEGVMLKLLNSGYTPGVRGKDWVKIKPEVDTLDLVVVGAEWGEGKRAHVYGSFLVAARQDDRLIPVSRVATGLSDEQLLWLYDTLKDQVIRTDEKMVYFDPILVFEIGYSEIQQSPNYEGGFALRFPRFVQVREDKDIRDANTLGDIQELYRGSIE
jgi:DNA ligase-1